MVIPNFSSFNDKSTICIYRHEINSDDAIVVHSTESNIYQVSGCGNDVIWIEEQSTHSNLMHMNISSGKVEVIRDPYYENSFPPQITVSNVIWVEEFYSPDDGAILQNIFIHDFLSAETRLLIGDLNLSNFKSTESFIVIQHFNSTNSEIEIGFMNLTEGKYFEINFNGNMKSFLGLFLSNDHVLVEFIDKNDSWNSSYISLSNHEIIYYNYTIYSNNKSTNETHPRLLGIQDGVVYHVSLNGSLVLNDLQGNITEIPYNDELSYLISPRETNIANQYIWTIDMISNELIFTAYNIENHSIIGKREFNGNTPIPNFHLLDFDGNYFFYIAERSN